MEAGDWILVTVGGGIGLWVAKASLSWLVDAIANAVVLVLDTRLDLDTLRRNVSPPAGKWPNGSKTLPDSMTEIYRRVERIERKVNQ